MMTAANTRSRPRGTRRRLLVATAALATIAGGGCRPPPPAEPASERALEAATTVAPLADLVRRIGGAEVEVFALLAEGAVPELYEPAPRRLQRLARVDLFVKLGIDSLALETRHVAPLLAGRHDLRVVDVATAAGLADFRASGAAEDPHLWLSPRIMRAAAAAVAAALSSLAPERADGFASRLQSLETEIDRLDAELRARLAHRPSPFFLVQHPAWGHFADSYGLQQIAIEHEGKEPGARALIELAERARRERCAVVLAQRGFSDAAARTIAQEIGAEVVVVDPLAADWMASLRAAAAALGREGSRAES